ncbi:MAG: glycosyltransferase family 2 protein [Lachnospiraceae bacterium]|nr:glycosyltransferase family 2 protein [Lachnospiraceae bacterium]
MKFSIIVPAHNVERYIVDCVESLLKQTFRDFEIILLDDCSTDKTLKIIYEKYNDNELIRVVANKENLGVSNTRNIGLEMAKGEWITFLDADDWLECNALEKINGYINRYNDVDLIQSNLMVHDARGIYRYQELSELVIEEKKQVIESIISVNYGIKKYGKYGNCRCAGGKFYKNELIKKTNVKFNSKLYLFEDGIFNLHMYKAANKILIVNDAFYNYRRISTSGTKKYSKEKEIQNKLILQEIGAFINNDKAYLMSYCYCIYDFLINEIYNFAGVKEYNNKIHNVKRIVNKNRNKKAIRYIDVKNLGKRDKLFLFLINHKMYVSLYLAIFFIKKYIDN